MYRHIPDTYSIIFLLQGLHILFRVWLNFKFGDRNSWKLRSNMYLLDSMRSGVHFRALGHLAKLLFYDFRVFGRTDSRCVSKYVWLSI